MILFHGSDVAVPEPKILSPSRLLDFGEGFYTTSSYEQATSWARSVKIRRNTKSQIISVYEFDMSEAAKALQILRFGSPDSQWLQFVTACRSGKKPAQSNDIVIGPVVNDNVYATIQLFETGLLSEAETIIRLKVEEIYDQILFHTERALEYLRYVKQEDLGEDENG